MPSSIVMPINSISRRPLKNSTRRAAVALESLPPLMPIAMRSPLWRWTWDRSSRFARRSTKPDRSGDRTGDDSAENPRNEEGPEERPPMTLRESPASHQALRRVRVFHHDRGRIEARGNDHVEGDQAPNDEHGDATADRAERDRRIGRSPGERQQDQEERYEYEREEEEGEQEACPKDAEESVQAPPERPFEGDGFSTEPPDRELGHPAADDAVEDRARDDRDDREEHEVGEGGRRDAHRRAPGEQTGAGSERTEDCEGDERSEETVHEREDEKHDEEFLEVHRPNVNHSRNARP